MKYFSHDHFRGSIFIVSMTVLFFSISTFFMSLWYHPMHVIVASALVRGRVDLGIASEYVDGAHYESVSPYPDDTMHLDLAWYRGHIYLPMSPLPAFLFVPFMPVIEKYSLWHMANSGLFVLLNFLNFYILFRLASLFLKKNPALWMSFAFVFGSSYILMVFYGMASYLNHVLAVTMLLAALLEYCSRKRYWVIGLLVGFAFATRVPAGLGLLFFLAMVMYDTFFAYVGHGPIYSKIWTAARRLIAVLVPFVSVVALNGLYNYARFGDFLETGYTHQVGLPLGYPLTKIYGLFHLVYIPQNVKIFFFYLPQLVRSPDGGLAYPFLTPHLYGMSFLLATPFVVLLLRVKGRDFIIKALGGTVLLIFTFLMLLFSPGNTQYGSRFSLDFLPFLWLLIVIGLSHNHVQLPHWAKFLIIISASVNLYFVALTSTLGLAFFSHFFVGG